VAGADRPDLHRALLAAPEVGRGLVPHGLAEGLRLRHRLRQVGLVITDSEQVVLESDPPRRLAYTWHTFSPEWAAAHQFDEATVAAWRAEPRSKVAFDIEEAGEGVVKLTVVHDGFAPGSAVLEGVRGGWPAVIASLKTLLETGSALPSA